MILLGLLILGLISGSFVNALVWRLHEQYSSKVKRQQKKYSIVLGHSMCPNCGHSLKALDLIPILSWLMLRGKCRYCHSSISWQYPLIELLTPTLFLVSYIYWPIAFQEQGIFEFSLWLLFIVGFISLAIYDLRWSILPNRITYNLIKLAIFEFLVILVLFNGRISLMVSTFWGLVLSAGIFYILLFVSRGKWIGGGDVKLGIIIGFLIGGPGNSILMLLIASMLGSLYSIPLLAIGQAKKDSKIPFGPFLIISVIIVKLFGLSIINYYKKLII